MGHTGSHREKSTPPRRHRLSGSTWYAAITLSLLLHGALLPIFSNVTPAKGTRAARPPSYAALPILSQEDVKRLTMKTPTERRSTTPRPLPEPPKPPEKAQGQIVEIPPPAREEVPENARFVSDYNSKVEREQVSALNQAPTPDMIKSKELRLTGGKARNQRQERASRPKKKSKKSRDRTGKSPRSK